MYILRFIYVGKYIPYVQVTFNFLHTVDTVAVLFRFFFFQCFMIVNSGLELVLLDLKLYRACNSLYTILYYTILYIMKYKILYNMEH